MHQPGTRWRAYAWQSLCGAMAMLAAVLALDALGMDRALIVTSIGATAFILFLKPASALATPRCVIGGHLVGLAYGALVALRPVSSPLGTACLEASVVGVSLFVMAAT